MRCQQLRQGTWKPVPEDPDGTQQTRQAVEGSGGGAAWRKSMFHLSQL